MSSNKQGLYQRLIRGEEGVVRAVVQGVLGQEGVPALLWTLEEVLGWGVRRVSAEVGLRTAGRGVQKAGREEWCEDLWMGALFEAQSWRPEVAAQGAEQEVEQGAEGGEGDWGGPGCLTLYLCPSLSGIEYIDPRLQAEVSSVKPGRSLF